jgi:GntR family transcriptional repressor for pyruvate dehydrogenase complex
LDFPVKRQVYWNNGFAAKIDITHVYSLLLPETYYRWGFSARMEKISTEDYILKNRVCDNIKQYMIDNQLQPGAKLPTERNLAEILGVSRTVVREALGTLETLGYIDKTQGKGIFVKQPNLTPLFQEMLLHWGGNKDQFRAICEFRLILEQAAVEWIIANASSADFQQLIEIIDESERKPLTRKQFIKYDYQFHQELLRLTGNPLFTQLTDVINKYFQYVALKENENTSQVVYSSEITNGEHRRLIACMQAKDREGAVRTIREHFSHPRYDACFI